MSTVNINDFKTIKEVEDYRKKINEACDKFFVKKPISCHKSLSAI